MSFWAVLDIVAPFDATMFAFCCSVTSMLTRLRPEAWLFGFRCGPSHLERGFLDIVVGRLGDRRAFWCYDLRILLFRDIAAYVSASWSGAFSDIVLGRRVLERGFLDIVVGRLGYRRAC